MHLFHKAIRKYGEDVWDHELLEVMLIEAGAKRAEVLWIAQKKSYAFDQDGHGYNMTRGGEGVVGLKMTEESKRQMSHSQTGKKRTIEHRQNIGVSGKQRYANPVERERTREALLQPEIRKKMSENGKGKNKGRVMSEETRQKIRDGLKRYNANKLGV